MARLLVDMDDTILDFTGALIDTYNKLHGTNYTKEDVDDWDLSKKFGVQIYDIFYIEGFYRHLKPFENAIEVLERLSRKHEILIVTASPYGPAMMDKGLWFKHYLGHILPEENFIITWKKYLITGDVLFDDGPHNLTRFNGITIAMDHAHNRHVKPDYRVRSMLEFESIINMLYP